jgi:hypothetical protein
MVIGRFENNLHLVSGAMQKSTNPYIKNPIFSCFLENFKSNLSTIIMVVFLRLFVTVILDFYFLFFGGKFE